ncbi:MAG: hypothetical protein H0T68_11235 [Gemmatimonadales bacterium]|nr:hypothetical protein [Gemmatimonadales bacterium]
MPYRRLLRLAALTILVGAPTSFWLACGGGEGNLTDPDLGTIEITAATSGPEPDADGYAITIDGAGGRSIGPNGTLRVEGLESGTHVVGLSGAAPNCSVADQGSAAIDVVRGSTVSVRFAVDCRATTGAVQITTSTGPNADADGYSLLFDGVERQPIGVGETVILSGLSPGGHTVGLSGLAANCRIEGDNPRAVTVVAGETTPVGISAACDPPPPLTGTLRVITATSGADPDPDGFRFRIDEAQEQPVGANATVSVTGLAAGPHTVRLLDLAANCTVTGDDLLSITVAAGATVDVSYAIACSAATGELRVTTRTTGSPRDADGYELGIDGGAAQPIGSNASLTLDGLSVGPHDVTLQGLAPECQVQGEASRTVAVAASATTTVTFEVICAAATGSLTGTITGLPDGADADVTVTGPNGYSQRLTETRTLDDLVPGEYTVAAAGVTAGGDPYAASPTTQSVTVTEGEVATATVTYARASTTSLNLRIDGLYLTQSVQTLTRGVALVEGRDGYLRVFTVANETNSTRPSVRVRLSRNGALLRTFTIAAEASTPTTVDEGLLSRSWNVDVPGALIQPGLEVVADVDPDDKVAETDETDNSYPASGEPLELEVRTASALRIMLVPVRQKANGFEGEVSAANSDRFLDVTRRLYPLPGYDAEVHDVYTTTTSNPLDADDSNGSWTEILNEILALQTAEAGGSGRHYYGVVRAPAGARLDGIGYLDLPAAMGYDDPSDGGRVLAHELGHNWGRLHSACGNPGDVDRDYPHANGLIGVYGFDVPGGRLKGPAHPDIMGYCRDSWISDFNYKAVLGYRARHYPEAAQLVAAEQRCILVWGRIVGGRAILEPAFEVVTRPSLPPRGGPYSVAGYADDGTRLFELSFEGVAVADGRRGGRHFAFAVPLDDAAASRLGTLRLAGPGVQAVAESPAASLRRTGAGTDSVSIRPAAGGAALQWDAAVHPMIMVRDAGTGQVLSFARGGRVEVRATGGDLELVASDGVRSWSTRRSVSGR